MTLMRRTDYDIGKKKTNSGISNDPPNRGNCGLEFFYAGLSFNDGDGHDLRK
jgi:hypothetical protein